MKLIGGTRSPYVRRVAISLTLMGFDYAHEATSPFESPDAIRQHNPLTRIPTLILEDGEVLVESYAILDALNEMAEPDKRLVPMAGEDRRRVMKLTAVATGATDKLIWSVYERRFRPAEKIHQPWIEHNVSQLLGELAYLEGCAGDSWLAGGDSISLADVGAVVALQQTEMARPDLTPRTEFPQLAALAQRCEPMAAFSSVAPA
ncbi:MAG: glutathione S-transferase family protein [Rhodospirillaceae bacterium]|nr:glutathione S-transferase family protein [Rhodospirillaceae bacterium]